MSWLSKAFDDLKGAVQSVASIPGVGTLPGIGQIVGIGGPILGLTGGETVKDTPKGMTPAPGIGQQISDPIIAAINADVASVEQSARDNFLIFGTYALLGIVMLIALYAIVAPSMDIDLGDVRNVAELAG